MRRSRSLLATVALFALVACGSAGNDTGTGTTIGGDTELVDDAAGEQRFPEVIGAEARLTGTTWTFDVTISSPYDSAERYADAWRILGPDGTVYGVRVLTHDHASEQPFTRSLAGVEIPDDVDAVTIEGRVLALWLGRCDVRATARLTGADAR